MKILKIYLVHCSLQIKIWHCCYNIDDEMCYLCFDLKKMNKILTGWIQTCKYMLHCAYEECFFLLHNELCYLNKFLSLKVEKFTSEPYSLLSAEQAVTVATVGIKDQMCVLWAAHRFFNTLAYMAWVHVLLWVF